MGLALIILLCEACFEIHGCGTLDDCSGDSDCELGFICDNDGSFLVGRSCIAAVECESDASCPSGQSCEQRVGDPANNPFENDSPGKKICVCDHPGAFGVCKGGGGQGGGM